MDTIQQAVVEQTSALLNLLGYDIEPVVSLDGETYVIQIDTNDTGVLIGYHGQTLSALQTILGHMLYKKTGQWLRLSLNVSDYWQKREEQLSLMANRAVDEVLRTHSSYTLPYLNARERRYIHMLLQDTPGITTESVGEGVERRLVIFSS